MKILTYIKLTRPVNVIITGLSVFLGAVICGDIGENWLLVALAMISAGIVAAAGNVINDFFDIEIDRINKPNRPLPSGKLSGKSALIFYGILVALSLVMALFINGYAILIVFFANFLMFLYSWKLKRTALFGNLTVALVSGLAFIYGGISVKQVKEAFIPAGFAFLFHLGREIVKDIEDVEGDKVLKANTLPIKLGENFSIWIASGVFILLIIVTLFPYFFYNYNLKYLIIVILGVDFGLIYFIFCLHNCPDKNKLHGISNLLKIQMLIGIISIYLGTR